MIIGRTPAGLIKTKSDGGLRAVNCACCDTCPCGVTIPQALRELVANATIDTITMFGLPPLFFYPVTFFSPDSWYAIWSYDGFSTPILLNAEILYYPETGCLYTSGFYTEWNGAGIQPAPFPLFGSILGVQAFGDGQPCEQPFGDQTTANGTFTINGEGAYKYYYFTGIDPNTGLDYLAVPPPNFVFT